MFKKTIQITGSLILLLALFAQPARTSNALVGSDTQEDKFVKQAGPELRCQ